MKKKHLEYMSVISLILLSFFLGRESKTVKRGSAPGSCVEEKVESMGKVEFQSLETTNSLIDPLSNVYVCNGRSSKRYHFKKNCRGLSSCGSSISEVTIVEAKKRDRTLCGWED